MPHYYIKYKPGYRANKPVWDEEREKKKLENKIARIKDAEEMKRKNAERKQKAEAENGQPEA